ncbi:MAG: hypothetical protein C5B58_05265 [Acidobacteria bacterium]|nr:MAG: hypothetical protein C5B58_05265 [Acidobacteriota bacterium]
MRARQLTEPLFFTDPLGREHRGLPGDYLVESSDGFRRIAPRMIFEDVYVPMETQPPSPARRPEGALTRAIAPDLHSHRTLGHSARAWTG